MPPSDVQSFKIILGSSSMSRRQILAEMGYEFSIMTADIDEKAIRKEKPEDLVMALAEAKADAVTAKLQEKEDYQRGDEQTILLITADQVLQEIGCDTSDDQPEMIKNMKPSFLASIKVVVHGGIIREKPSSKEEARQFIKCYSGSCASTVGSVLVTNLKTGIRKGGWNRDEVYFHEIPEEVIESLIEEGAVLYVAGGLMVEHPLTSPFVNAMVGTIDSVMGLPKALTEKLIQEAISEPHFT